MQPLAIIGHIARDRIGNGPPRPGGGPWHAARALPHVSARARLVVRCARDDRARLLPPLVASGIPVVWRGCTTTVSFSFTYRGEERLMHVDGVGDPWTPEDAGGWVGEALRRTRWVHLAALLRSDFPPETLAVLARNRRLSFDGQGLVRVPRAGPLQLDGDYDPELLRYLTVLKLAEEEANVLVGEPTEEALRSFGVPEVIVTLGSRGSLVLANGGLVHVPAHPLPDEPTGAGDAFAAGYLAARSIGHSPLSAARRATSVVAAVLPANRRR